MNESLKYRPEIDGLRALAVLPVILFHAGFDWLSGGFLGVDIFFVISGFLITSILVNQLASDRFSLVRFYERRARRILPVLYVMMLTCLPVAYVAMPPEQFGGLAESIGAVSFFVSNIYFWQELDYFSTASELLPMIHTWSLGVEEQYYLIFPLLLLGIYRYMRRCLLPLLFIIALVSVAAAELGSSRYGIATFYLLPFRAWELLLGSCGALVSLKAAGQPRILRELLSSLGLILIGYALLNQSEETPTPSLATLAPVGGALLIILFARADTFLGRALAASSVVWIGQASYSLYLWHQPVFSFARLNGISFDHPGTVVALIILVFALSACTLHYVERPFRNQSFLSTRTVFACTFLVCASGMALATYSYQKGFDHLFYSESGTAFLKNYEGQSLVYPELYREDCNYYLSEKLSPSCLSNSQADQPTTLIWGDSHAQGLAVGLRNRFGRDRFFAQVATSSCRPAIVDADPDSLPAYAVNARAFKEACLKANATATRFLRTTKVESVVFHVNSMLHAVDWDVLLTETARLGIDRIFIVAPVPQWNASLPTVHALQLGAPVPKPLVSYLREQPFEDTEFVRALATDSRVVKLFPVDKLCSSRAHCLTVVPGKSPQDPDAVFAFDYGHLALSGSIYIAETLFEPYFGMNGEEK
jgi:peptidoglycan/LPS O-acetylase OafA/YrhL